MIKKYYILIGILTSLILLLIASFYYPGGSQFDKNSIGFDWKNNCLCNLFGEKVVNGGDNTSRPLAISGMFFICASFALFFIEFSMKISSKFAAGIIKYFGAVAMIFAFLAVTQYHDTMITIASILALVSMFYIAVFVFKSKLYLLKILCIVCLLVCYYCNYIYYTRNHLEFLPIMQKVALVITILWILSLQYFTSINDFKSRKTVNNS